MDTIYSIIYNIIGMFIVLNLALGAFAFGHMGWGASKRALPMSALFGYVCAFFTAALAGVTCQLVFG